MILFNILSLVALASTLVLLMITGQDAGLGRSLRFREASQASAIARAGELSVIVALQRDAVEAPQRDHLREPWAAVIERDASIAGGRFSLSVTDAQARFNLNGLASANASPALASLLSGLRLDPALVGRIAVLARQQGRAPSVQQLLQLGVDPAILARLAPMVTVLPGTTPVNLNTASESLIAMLVGSPEAAKSLVERRTRNGFLTDTDFSELRVFVPQGAGFTSRYFWVRTTVTIGETRQTLVSLLERQAASGRPKVVTLGRWRGAAAPDQVPLLQL